MPRLVAYGLAGLAFLAGFVLAGTLTFEFRATETVAVEPTATPTPTIGPCSAEWERAYEIMRFAQYSHEPWLRRALENTHAGRGYYAEVDVGQSEAVAVEQWWIDHYAEVLAAIEGECVPAPAYPNLTELPGSWGPYPTRTTTE